MPVFDVKTEKMLDAKQLAELVKEYVDKENWVIAAYYVRLLAREIASQMRKQRPPTTV